VNAVAIRHIHMSTTSKNIVQKLINNNKKIAPHLKKTPINCPRSKKGTLKTCRVPVADGNEIKIVSDNKTNDMKHDEFKNDLKTRVKARRTLRKVFPGL